MIRTAIFRRNDVKDVLTLESIASKKPLQVIGVRCRGHTLIWDLYYLSAFVFLIRLDFFNTFFHLFYLYIRSSKTCTEGSKFRL